MKIEIWEIDLVKPYKNNPRLNASAVPEVVKSIREFGFRQPIVVDKKGVIVVGHTRFLAAKELQLARVPVHVAGDLKPAQVKAYRLADNKTAEFAEWDFGKLRIELSELQSAGVELGDLGFTAESLAEIFAQGLAAGLTDPDAVPAPPDKPISKRGDIWQLGQHRLMCGDSSSPADLDRLLAGSRIHLVNTDPPYNVKVEPRSNNAIAAGNSSFSAKRTHHQGMDLARHPGKANPTEKKLRAKDRPLENDFVSDAEFDRLLAAWFGNMSRVLEPGRGFYIWGGYANCANYPPALKTAGMYFSQALIWVKEHPVLTRKDFMGNHEWCFYGWREGAAHYFGGRPNIPDVWELSRAPAGQVAIGRGVRLEGADGSRIDLLPPAPDRDRLRQVRLEGDAIEIHGPQVLSDVWRVRKVTSKKMVHLTEKPVELAVRALQLSSRPGEHVLDLFGGSGSTLIAAEQTGRQAFLMELDPLYCDVIVQRFEQFAGTKAQRLK